MLWRARAPTAYRLHVLNTLHPNAMFQWNLRTFPPFRDPLCKHAAQFMQFDAQWKKRAASADYAWTIETGGDSVLTRCESLLLAFPPNSHEEERAQRGAQ